MTIISTILGVESSGGHNVTQGNIGDINNINGTPAQGYFQIIDPTWLQYGGAQTGFGSALNAPYATQLQIAQNIPVNQWGPATQNALAAQGYTYTGNETLGQLLGRYGEDPTATVPADGAQNFTSTGSGDSLSATSGGSPYDNATALNAYEANPNSAFDTSIAGNSSDAFGANGANLENQGTPNLGGGITQSSQNQQQDQYTKPGGEPITVTNLSDTGAFAGQDVQAGLGTLTTGVTTAEAAAAGTATTLTNTWLTGLETAFVNGTFVVLGLLVLAGAFLFFYMERKNVVSLSV